MRIHILTFVIIGVFAFLILGLVNLTLVRGRDYRQLSEQNCIRLIPQPGARGNILDRNGIVIAGSKISYDIVVLPQEATQLERTFALLSGIVGLPSDELRTRFWKNYSSPSMPVTVARNVRREKAIAVAEKKLDIDGVIVQPSPQRNYPFGKLACHVIGYLNEIDRWRLTKLGDYGYKTKDIMGFGGIEERYDYYLRQEDGGLSVEVDHQGRFTRVVGYRAPQTGRDIQLTIDSRVQKIVESVLEDNKGGVVIMDPANGQIIAMASNPGFDPSLFVSRNPAVEEIFADPSAPLFNRCISGTYPPGSVFKTVVAVTALENRKITPATTSYCTGSLQVGNRQFKCWDTHYQQDLTEAIAHSCDVYFYRTGLACGAQALADFSGRFGLGRPTGIELPYEEGGFVPSPLWRKLVRFQNWYAGDTANLAIGQGELLASPLQMCRVMAVFANNGKLVTPNIIKGVAGVDVSARHIRTITAPFNKSSLAAVRRGLLEAVQDPSGTARALADLPVSVAGKTGTAEIGRGPTHAWFSGFFPYDTPRYAFCIFLEKGGHGSSSATLLRRIIEMMLQEGIV